MFNLTHDESSAVDVSGVWVGPDEFELHFRFNADDQEDLEVVIVLDHGELQGLVRFLDQKLTTNMLRNM